MTKLKLINSQFGSIWIQSGFNLDQNKKLENSNKFNGYWFLKITSPSQIHEKNSPLTRIKKTSQLLTVDSKLPKTKQNNLLQI